MRWQGTTSMIAFLAHALPAARTAFGLPEFLARSAYERTLPARIRRIAFHAAWENEPPG